MDVVKQFGSRWEWKQQTEWNHIHSNHSSYTGVRAHGDQKALFGSLRYYDDPEVDEHVTFLHYYVTEFMILTNLLDLSRLQRTNEIEFYEKMEMSESALEGFFILLAEVANTFLDGIDTFENSLRSLEKEMKEGRNEAAVFDKIVEHRFQLLHWTSLIIPLQETLYSAKEVFIEDLEKNKEFRRASFRIERLITLQHHYEDEINTLLSIDDNITNYRGNEIVRALTIFTVIFTPVSALGAIWGMNFKFMPEINWKWGYMFSITIILTSQFCVYMWLRKKGWFGDLLKGKRSK